MRGCPFLVALLLIAANPGEQAAALDRGRTALALSLPPLGEADPGSKGPEQLSAWLSGTSAPFRDLDGLRALLEFGGFDTLVVWLDPTDLPATLPTAAFPLRPRARLHRARPFALQRQAPELADLTTLLIETLKRSGVQVAFGRNHVTRDDGALDGTVLLQSGDDSTTLPLLSRPGVRNLLWFDPRFLRLRLGELEQSGGLHLSLDLSAQSRSELQPAQGLLDVLALAAAREGREADLSLGRLHRRLLADESFAAARPALDWLASPALRRLLHAQSETLSRVARAIGGSEPHRYVLEKNLWQGGPPPPFAQPAWRQEPAELDLLEWTLSEPSAAHLTLLAVNALRGMDSSFSPPTDPSETRADDPEAGHPPGLESPRTLRLLQRSVSHRLRASRALARLLVHGNEEDRVKARQELERMQAALGEDAGLSAAWANTLALDRRVLEEAIPFRMQRLEWHVSGADQGDDDAGWRSITYRADDPRYLGWAQHLARRLGGTRVYLSPWRQGTSQGPFVLRTELPMTDSRQVRLFIAGDWEITVRLNGASVIAATPPLTHGATRVIGMTVPVGRNKLEVGVQAPARAAPRFAPFVDVELAILPDRFEGTTFYPVQAREVQEPLARLEHPSALEDTVLAVPRARHPAGSPRGSADFFLDVPMRRRVDVWVHGLSADESDGWLELEFAARESRRVRLTPGAGWQWIRLPAPVMLEAGSCRIRLLLDQPGLMVDAITLITTGIRFPRPPPGNISLHDLAWRYDAAGIGQVMRLPSAQRGEGYGFLANRSGTYRVFLWMRGAQPLLPGQYSALELQTLAGTFHFLLSAGAPTEEWLKVGRISLTADERVRIKVVGDGDPVALAFVP